MRNLLRRTIAAPLLLALLATPAAADRTFNIGSLIIPTSGTYQTDCGAVSVYGLVYNVLRANAWLATQPAAVAPGGAIQVFYSYKDPKGSPNRCAPTNASITPAPLGDAKWTDGCDFSVTNTGLAPVTLVRNHATAIGNDVPLTTFDTTTRLNIYPQYAAETVTSPTVSTVRYMGGPFVIDSSDAPTFLKLLEGSITAKDSQGNDIDFSPFRPNTAGVPQACAYGTDVGGYVFVHRARTVFTAPAAKAFSIAPPRLALLATGGPKAIDVRRRDIESSGNNGAYVFGGVIRFTTQNTHGYVAGDIITVSGVSDSYYNQTYTVAAGSSGTTIITTKPGSRSKSGGGRAYLTPGATKSGTIVTMRTSSPHLFLVGDSITVSNLFPYNGTFPVLSVIDSTTFTYDSGSATAWGYATSNNGRVQKSSGSPTQRVDDGILQKYLSLAGLDFPGARGCPPGGANITSPGLCPLGGTHGQIYDTFDFSDFTTGKLDSSYKMVWTPHWETKADDTTPPTATEQAAMSAISTFLDGQTGLMAECYSIESFEGGWNGSSKHVQTFNGGQFQTCKDTGSATCDVTFTAFGIQKNPSSTLASSSFFQNCSDPGLSNGDECIHFGNPGDPFVQTGDFMWYTQTGAIQHYNPNQNSPKSVYRPGVSRLVSGVTNLVTGAGFPGTIDLDYVTRNTKDDNPAKGNILYMAGHDVSGTVSGTKTILQTLLLLGEPPITTITREVTRASPVATTLSSGTAIIQGTFEKVEPPNTTRTFSANADASTFRFPDLLGHLRGYDPATITGQLDLTDAALTILFDAANQIPPTTSSYSGCSSYFTKDCRTIFTHTANGPNPSRVFFESANASTLLPYLSLTAPVSAIDATGAGDLMQKVIAGYEASPGVFEARLGGVDRSTVAVVPSSLLAGGARPKMIYFGATDGMLHAVCAEVTGACDVVGRELWAFIPKYQLPNLRLNTARIDGSPRVMDMFGDFSNGGLGARTFRTVLVFQTTGGDPGTTDTEPSIVALDITTPTDPKIIFEAKLPGQGLIVNAGRVRVGGTMRNLAFAQTNNGSVTPGNVVTAFDMETGTQVWQHAYTFTTSLRSGGTSVPPVTGIPGGAVGVDRDQTGSLSDVMFGTLYGDIWQLDAVTGQSRNGTDPVFRFTTDEHPFGTPPTIYSRGNQAYSVSVSGGYADLAASTLWSAASGQKAVSVKLLTAPLGSKLDETSTSGAGQPLAWTIDLNSGDKAFAQATVVGGEILITTDSADVNANGLSGYGASPTDTGSLYSRSLADGSGSTLIALRGGAGSIATTTAVAPGTTDVYALSKDKAEHVTVTTTSGESLGSPNTGKVTRMLWLRTL